MKIIVSFLLLSAFVGIQAYRISDDSDDSLEKGYLSSMYEYFNGLKHDSLEDEEDTKNSGEKHLVVGILDSKEKKDNGLDGSDEVYLAVGFADSKELKDEGINSDEGYVAIGLDSKELKDDDLYNSGEEDDNDFNSKEDDLYNSGEEHYDNDYNSKENDLYNSGEEHHDNDYNSKENDLYNSGEEHHDNDYNSKENDLYNSGEEHYDNDYNSKENDLYNSGETDDKDLYSSEDLNEDSDEYLGGKVRSKRQAREHAIGLASDHSRPVGKVHTKVLGVGGGNNARNYQAYGGIGAGTVVHRSKNNRHSIGVGAFAEQHRGRVQGFRYKSKPNVGFGASYKFRF